jgi:predicted acetyltransferase
MPKLVRPSLEVHRSFLAAMAEFRGDGRGGVYDNSMIGLENREFGKTWDTLEGFATYVQKIRRDADEDALRPAGWVACTTLWYVEDAEYLGRLAIRHRLTDLLRDSVDGVLVGQKAHVGATTLSDHDDATGDHKDLLAHQLGYVGMRIRLSGQS